MTTQGTLFPNPDGQPGVASPGTGDPTERPDAWFAREVEQSTAEIPEFSIVSPIFWLRAAILGSLFCMTMDGALPQLQMALLGGNSPIAPIAIKVIFGISLALFTLLTGRASFRNFTATWLIFVGYLLLDIIHLLFDIKLGLGTILAGYYLSYVLVLSIPVVESARVGVSEKTMVRVLLVGLVVAGALGILQYLLQKPILPLQSSDGNFKVTIWNRYGTIRAFSLFSVPSAFGGFAALTGCLALAISRTTRSLARRTGCIFLYLIAAMGCYASQTRGCYIFFFITSCFTWFLGSRRGALIKSWMPVVPPLIVVVVLFANVVVATVSKGIGDASTFFERIQSWRFYFQTYLGGTFERLLCGLGLNQDMHLKEGKTVAAIDNLYLGILVYIGALGLILFAVYYVSLWRRILQRVEETGSPLSIAVAAVWAALPTVGIFNDLSAMVALYYVAYVVCAVPEKQIQI